MRNRTGARANFGLGRATRRSAQAARNAQSARRSRSSGS